MSQFWLKDLSQNRELPLQRGSQMLETSSSQDVLSNLEFIKIWVLRFSFAGQIKVLPKEPFLKI